MTICPRPDCDCCADNYVMFDCGYDRGDYTKVRPCPALPRCWPSDEALEEAMREAREGRRVSELIKRYEASKAAVNIHEHTDGR